MVAGLVFLTFFSALVYAQTTGSNTGYDKGFFIKNDEGDFQLKFNGRVQTQFNWFKDPTRVSATTPKSQFMSFNFRRAFVAINAKMADIVNAGFTLLHATQTVPAGNTGTQNVTFATVNVTGATASIELIPEFAVAVGMVGLPLDMMSEISSAWLLSIEKPITSSQDDGGNVTPDGSTIYRSSFGTPDGLGVNFSGSYWKWFYSASVVNSTESNYTANFNRRFSFGFRTGFNILDSVGGSMTDFECSESPKLTVSVGTMYQAARWLTVPATVAAIPVKFNYLWTSSLGVALRWGGLAFTTEGYYRKTKLGNTPGGLLYYRPNLTDVGYYAALGYYAIPKKFEIAAQAAQIFRQGPDNNSYGLGGGLNYYIFDNNLKLQLAYALQADFDATPDSGAAKIHNITLMASAAF